MNVGNPNITYFIKWTPLAIECFERNCICDGCDMQNLESKCLMKDTVLKVFAELGKPPEPKKEISIDEIYEYIDQGLSLKEIAKIFGKSPVYFCQYTKKLGINGSLLRGGELQERYRRRRNVDKKRARGN